MTFIVTDDNRDRMNILYYRKMSWIPMRLHRRLFWKAKESMFIDGSEGKNENQNSDIINHGSGASGSW